MNNIIIHGIHIHDCKHGGNAYVRKSPTICGWRSKSDGDGLIDAIRGSTAITISNNYMTDHNKVMLLVHNDNYKQDKNMQGTIAFNHFGDGLVQRMSRYI